MTEDEFRAQLEAATLALEVRDLAFEIADTCCAFDIETYHYTVVSGGATWHDLNMLHNADQASNVERAVRYLTMRGFLVRNDAYPNLVRVEKPASADAEDPQC